MGPEHIGTGHDVALLNIAALVSRDENNAAPQGAFLEWRARHPEASQRFIDAIETRYPKGTAQRILHGFALALEVDAETVQVEKELAQTFQDLANNPDAQSLGA